ncbi:MAG: rod shape-determining protein RodA, partial [Bacteroidales bacterium]|nr:rod shape-determining protein RodA [Bacteroidales bacterium]
MGYYERSQARRVDMGLVLSYLVLVLFGWMNIYSAVYSEEHSFILDFTQRYGLQFIWILISIGVALFILYIINPGNYAPISPFLYIGMLLLLAAVIFLGREVNGSKSWFFIGSFGFQPAEFSKITTSLLLAYVMSQWNFSLSNRKDAMRAALVVLLPILLIVLEKETGSALVYLGLILVFYMEGLSGWVIILGLSLIATFIITMAGSPLAAVVTAISAAALLRFTFSRKSVWLLTAIPVIILMCFIPALSRVESLSFLRSLRSEVWALILFIPHTVLWIKDLFTGKENRPSFFLLLSLLSAVILTFSVNFIFTKVLQPHQRARIENL